MLFSLFEGLFMACAFKGHPITYILLTVIFFILQSVIFFILTFHQSRIPLYWTDLIDCLFMISSLFLA
jgi:hypothetical protein